jgi:predicted AAA+ superfamily ATPase
MQRLIDRYLLEWKESTTRKSLILHGARQIGKTYAARQLGATFEHFVEFNFEESPQISTFFEETISPEVLLPQLESFSKTKIIPGKTLLFFDEIQVAPRALTSLRYFYEQLPGLHVIAAGSLLDFTINEVGMPVGRVESLYMFPLTFLEFLYAMDEHILVERILDAGFENPMPQVLHEKSLRLVGQYLAVGGMPAVVQEWRSSRSPLNCYKIQNSIIDTYRQDFNKYARKSEIKYVSSLFDEIPRHIGRKFKFSDVPGEYRKRELSPALELLETAGVIHKIFYTAAQGLPLGALVNPDDFKIIFLDSALTQQILGLDAGPFVYDPFEQFVNKGELVEAFVGQELLAYAPPYKRNHLYYWHRDVRGSQAEVDYVMQRDSVIIPLEVKSGSGSTLKSMHSFLESHTKSPYGIRFSTHNFSELVLENKIIRSMPLYAIFVLFAGKQGM